MPAVPAATSPSTPASASCVPFPHCLFGQMAFWHVSCHHATLHVVGHCGLHRSCLSPVPSLFPPQHLRFPLRSPRQPLPPKVWGSPCNLCTINGVAGDMLWPCSFQCTGWAQTCRKSHPTTRAGVVWRMVEGFSIFFSVYNLCMAQIKVPCVTLPFPFSILPFGSL